jgi:radical SAM/Cys-rich protein
MSDVTQSVSPATWPAFAKKVREVNVLNGRQPLETLQINIGKLCNQACFHCHVEASPKKIRENMDERTAKRLVELVKNSPQIKTVDLTGGAPEMNPHFRYLVGEFTKLGKSVIDRCNLTVLFEKGQETTPEFLAEQRVRVVASLPCYTKELVEKQRGRGVWNRSIQGILKLNELGYGKPGTGLELCLVYNPVGLHLPPAQAKLEADYKKRLMDDFGIHFNKLFTITNMPIKRFLEDLRRKGELEKYMSLLANAFNPDAANSVMCRSLVSVSWDGNLYDCDFNQQLNMPAGNGKRSVWDIQTFAEMDEGQIALADHCYGCTAGAGSSCGGEVI